MGDNLFSLILILVIVVYALVRLIKAAIHFDADRKKDYGTLDSAKINLEFSKKSLDKAKRPCYNNHRKKKRRYYDDF